MAGIRDAMKYDVMREIGNRVTGRYYVWSNRATSPAEAIHWKSEARKVALEIRTVRASDLPAVEAKLAELRDLFASLPVDAPRFRST